MAPIASTNNLCEIEANQTPVWHSQDSSWQPQPIDQSTDHQQSDKRFGLRESMNFVVMDKQSNLITGVITAPAQPTDTAKTLFIKIGEPTINKYYRLLSKARKKGLLVDTGELAAISHAFLDSLVETDRKRWTLCMVQGVICITLRDPV